jgi:hypothetical protein
MKQIAIVGCCRSGHNFIINQFKSWNCGLVFNFEDVVPCNANIVADAMVSEGVKFNPVLPTTYILVCRDLLNWWASYLKWITKSGEVSVSEDRLQNAFNIWKHILREAYNETHYLPNSIPLQYTAFTEVPTNRQHYCRIVEGEYSEKDLNKIPSAGGGSSFSGMTMDGLAGAMPISTRYVSILGTNLENTYLDMLSKNPECIDLYTKYFDISPVERALLDTLT